MRHISLRQFLVTLSLFGTLLTAIQVSAQETQGSATTATTATPTSASSPTSLPKPGSTMQVVKEKFGSASQEVPAVGTPAISRWEYPSYVVFFENDRVLHTVIK